MRRHLEPLPGPGAEEWLPRLFHFEMKYLASQGKAPNQDPTPLRPPNHRARIDAFSDTTAYSAGWLDRAPEIVRLAGVAQDRWPSLTGHVFSKVRCTLPVRFGSRASAAYIPAG